MSEKEREGEKERERERGRERERAIDCAILVILVKFYAIHGMQVPAGFPQLILGAVRVCVRLVTYQCVYFVALHRTNTSHLSFVRTIKFISSYPNLSYIGCSPK